MQPTQGHAIRSTPSRAIHRISTASATLVSALAIVALGCAGTPPVASAPPPDAQTIRVSTPLDWSRKVTACADAQKRARRAARKQCEVQEVVADKASCECSAGRSHAGTWRCSALAAYTCKGF